MTSDPNRYVQTDVGEARVNRVWRNVSERLEERPRRARVGWLVLGTAACAVAALAVSLVRTEPTALSVVESAARSDARLETAADSLSVTLVEGSRLSVAPHSEARVVSNRASAVSLALTRGELSCDVTHREGRPFLVTAHDVEVRVVGTQFSVRAGSGPDPRIEVSVTRGVVEVQSKRRPGVVARVAAGQTWIQNAESSAAAAAPSASEAGTAAPPPAVATELLEGTRPLPRSSAAPVASTSGPTARELFEKASESRRSGDAQAAARAYDELLRAYPGDPRAGLSAFELGRLRMDRLGDGAGAAVALERALALKVGPSFREDALARLVSIYAAQGNFSGCARARDRYLASYPAGVHAAAVTTRCGAR